MEDKNAIEDMFKASEGEEISYMIGSEIQKDEFLDCALVKANYHMGDNQIASIGVIGPQRMDYAKTAAALKFVVDELKKLSTVSVDTNVDNKPK